MSNMLRPETWDDLRMSLGLFICVQENPKSFKQIFMTFFQEFGRTP